MEKWIDEGVADGLILCHLLLPYSLEDFVELIVPELQKRGRFRSAYQDETFRMRLGLE